MKEKNALKIKKLQLTGLATWLNVLPLDGKKSRIRTRFVTKLINAIQQTDKERKDIVGKYVEKEKKEGEKNESWKTVTVDNGQTHFVISPEKLEEFNKEINELYEEDFVMAVTPETEENIAIIKDILLNTEYKFGISGDEESDGEKVAKVKQAHDYNEWCEAFEAVVL